ncbi:unnamed protein product [Chrysoparadoxa australica]
MVALLAVPLKRSPPSPIVACLQSLLEAEWGQQERSEGQQRWLKDCEQLDELRRVALNSVNNVAALAHYLREVTKVEAVIALPNEEQEGALELSWRHAFSREEEFTSRATQAFLLERIAVSYNIGCVESYLGSVVDMTSEGGLKEACHHFQQAAGWYQHVKDDLCPQLRGPVTTDLLQEGLTMVEKLMLAQAQTCFYEKAYRSIKSGTAPLKPSLVARLAAGASELFQLCGTFAMQQRLLAPDGWKPTIMFQGTVFSAMAQYWQSVAAHEVAEETGAGYGEEIARLRLAEEFMDKAYAVQGRASVAPTLLNQAGTQRVLIQKTRAAAEADNKSSYFESVPATMSLPLVQGVTMVKPLPPPPPSTEGSKLFEGLLPRAARSAHERLKAKSAEMVREVATAAAEDNRSLRAELAAVGLPGSIEAHESRGGIADSAWEKVHSAHARTGGTAVLKAKAAELERSAAQALAIMDSVQEALKGEEARDADFRARYHGYDAPDPAKATKDIHEDEKHYRALWEAAKASDGELLKKIENADLGLVDKTREELDDLMPGSDAGAGVSGGGADTSVLGDMLGKLAEIMNERGGVVSRLEEQARNVVTNTEGLMAQGDDYEGATDRLVKDIHVHVREAETKVAEALESQTSLLGDIMLENDAFQVARASDPITVGREAFLQRLHAAIALFHEVEAQLGEGLVFYLDLLRRLTMLSQTAQDFAYTQTLERREYEVNWSNQQERSRQSSIDEDMARRMQDSDPHASHSTQAPPALPPRPHAQPGGRSSSASPPPEPPVYPQVQPTYRQQYPSAQPVPSQPLQYGLSAGVGPAPTDQDPKVARSVWQPY